MIAKFAFFTLYALDSFVYAYKKISGNDLYEGRGYYSVIFGVSAVFLPFLWQNADLLEKHFQVLHPQSRNVLRMMLLLIVLSVTMSYLVNDFLFQSWFNDSLVYVVYALIGYILYMNALNAPATEFHSLKNIFGSLLCVHVMGIIILTSSNYDFLFVIKKIFVTQFADVQNNYEDSKLYFFGLAGNEEAYATLIYFLVAIGLWGFWRKIYIWPIGLFYFLYLGTRTAFLLYICFGVVLIWTEFRGKVFRAGFVTVMLLGVIAFSNSILEFLQNSFNVFSSGSITILDLTNILETDTLVWRTVTVWGTILSSITTPVNILFGLSRQGLNLLSDPMDVSLTATHNSFLYFYATLGVVGLLIYGSGYYLMVRSYGAIRNPDLFPRTLRVNYVMVVSTMIIYSFMNNAHSIQGMLLFLLVIAYGVSLRNPRIISSVSRN